MREVDHRDNSAPTATRHRRQVVPTWSFVSLLIFFSCFAQGLQEVSQCSPGGERGVSSPESEIYETKWIWSILGRWFRKSRVYGPYPGFCAPFLRLKFEGRPLFWKILLFPYIYGPVIGWSKIWYFYSLKGSILINTGNINSYINMQIREGQRSNYSVSRKKRPSGLRYGKSYQKKQAPHPTTIL